MMYVMLIFILVKYLLGKVETLSNKILSDLIINNLVDISDYIVIYKSLVLDRKGFFITHYSKNMTDFLSKIFEKLSLLEDDEIMYYLNDLSFKIYKELYKIYLKFFKRLDEKYNKKCSILPSIITEEMLNLTRKFQLKLNLILLEMNSFLVISLIEEIIDFNLSLINTKKILSHNLNIEEHLSKALEDSLHLLEKLCGLGKLFVYENTICKLINFLYKYLEFNNYMILNKKEYIHLVKKNILQFNTSFNKIL